MSRISQSTSRLGITAPQSCGGLSVLPLCAPSHEEPTYALLESAPAGAVTISEVSESGNVPVLRVDNLMDVRLFLMDGQELIGAKQNRILNTDVVVPAKSTLNVPVSCVERGRWAYRGRTVRPGKSASYRTRRRKSERVHESLRESGSFDADQHAVWQDVNTSLEALCCASSTSALFDAYQSCIGDLDDSRSSVEIPDDAIGLAVFLDSHFLGLDVFDRHATLQAVWANILDAYTIDFLHIDRPTTPRYSNEQIKSLQEILHTVGEGRWERFKPPGEGDDFRLVDQKFAASALVWEEKTVVHLQVFPRLSATASEPMTTNESAPAPRSGYASDTPAGRSLRSLWGRLIGPHHTDEQD